MRTSISKGLSVGFAVLIFVTSTFATDGYFETGYGVKQQGQGGAGVAFPADSLAGATNPAGLVLVGDRFDFVLALFRPFRDATITGNELADGSYDANRVKNF